jgi:predicted nicotinamide N-methyase
VKLKGKRVLELGSGTGLLGLSFALSGANVTLTDVPEALPLLRRNVASNLAAMIAPRAAPGEEGGEQEAGGSASEAAVGSCTVLEYTWGSPDPALGGPFDYIIGSDCVYDEKAAKVLLESIHSMCKPTTVVLLCNEFRSSSIADVFDACAASLFRVKKVPHARMDQEFENPLIDIWCVAPSPSSLF